MPLRHHEQHPFRTAAPFLFALILIGLWSLVSNQVSMAADAADQAPDQQITSGGLGVAPSFASATTIVRTPAGTYTGPDGVDAYVASLQRDYPDARFAVTDFRTVNSLVIIDWQGTVDGAVAIPGRTLITVEDGQVTKVTFLNRNDVARVGGASSQHADVATGAQSQYVIVDEQGNAIVPEQPSVTLAVAAATVEAQTWPALDPSSIAS